MQQAETVTQPPTSVSASQSSGWTSVGRRSFRFEVTWTSQALGLNLSAIHARKTGERTGSGAFISSFRTDCTRPSPIEAGEVRCGDLLVAVNGAAVDTWPLDAVCEALRSAPRPVTLVFERGRGALGPVTFDDILRDPRKTPFFLRYLQKPSQRTTEGVRHSEQGRARAASAPSTSHSPRACKHIALHTLAEAELSFLMEMQQLKRSARVMGDTSGRAGGAREPRRRLLAAPRRSDQQHHARGTAVGGPTTPVGGGGCAASPTRSCASSLGRPPPLASSIRQHQVRRRVLVAAARAARGLQLALRRVVASAPRRRRSQHHCTRAAPSRAPACLPPPPPLDAVEAGSSSLSQPATRLTVPSGRSLGDSYASPRRRRRVAIASAATFRAAQNSGASELAVRRRSQHRPPPASRACPTALEQRFVHENPPCDPHRARQKKRASHARAAARPPPYWG